MMRLGVCARISALSVAAFGFCGAAHAAPLYSLWNLDPTTEVGIRTVNIDQNALEQRLLPAKAVRLTVDAVSSDGKVTRAGTTLFLVSQADGKTAFCTVKDRSAGNAAKSLFIPALDKRPCFIDADEDGRFDSSFGVFDKYGSALTPSGNLDKATPLSAGGAFEQIPARDFPKTFALTYRLVGKKDITKARFDVAFDNGSGRPVVGIARNERNGNVVKVMNATFKLQSFAGDQATMVIETDVAAMVLGTSAGGFTIVDKPPPFLGGS